MSLKFAISITLLNFLGALAVNPCVPRDYGNGGSVCVCNYTYCDTLEHIQETDPGIVTLFESTKSGIRFGKKSFPFGAASPNVSGSVENVKIDHSQKFQSIVGFGGAFTDAAGFNIHRLPLHMQLRLISDYFSIDGNEYTLGRIPIAGSDFSTRPYSYDDTPNDVNLTHFGLAFEDKYYKMPYLMLAKAVSPHEVKFFGSPWSAPKWMKTNNDFKGKGQLKGKPGGEYYQIWANYFVKFLNAYKAHGLDIWGITIENEPGAGFEQNYTFNCMGFTAEMERDFLKLNLGPTLEKAGYGPDKLKIMIMDDQRDNLPKWADVILSDPQAAKYVAGVAFHWYHNDYAPADLLTQTHNRHPNYFLLGTEACEEWKGKKTKVSLGNWATGEKYAHDIITDLQNFAAGWVDWNLALDTQGRPNWAHNYVDAPIIVNAERNEYYKQPMYFALAHFSKFLLPGSVRIASSSTSSIDTVAFKTPHGATVLIAINRNDSPTTINVDDSQSGKFSHLVPGHSFQSYVWWDKK